jgi:hypothetical protein
MIGMTGHDVFFAFRAIRVPERLLSVARLASWQNVRVPQQSPTPTDPDREAAMGRIALWLDPEGPRWLAARCCCGDDVTELEQERCARVRFRANAALHKATASGA